MLRGAPYFFRSCLRSFNAAAVPLHRDHRLHDLAFMVDGAPEVAELAVDLHKDFIQVPPPLRIAAHARDTSLADLGGKYRAKPVPPKTERSRG